MRRLLTGMEMPPLSVVSDRPDSGEIAGMVCY